VFGGSPSSKLFMNVREKKSLCYYCQPVVDGKRRYGHRERRRCKEQDVAFEAIMEQLKDVQNGVISDEELSDAKKSLENAYREITDSPASVCRGILRESSRDAPTRPRKRQNLSTR
jgi:predicted Zn-dependent peptidase